jgi:molecular chaperone IbpA
MYKHKKTNTLFWNDFDKTFHELSEMFDGMFGAVQKTGYPPYDIASDNEGRTVINVALAGIRRDEVEVFVEGNVLHIKYDKPEEQPWDAESTKTVEEVLDEAFPDKVKKVLHKGIAKRSFDLKFQIKEDVVVVGASMSDGMLNVVLRKDTGTRVRKDIEIS